MTDAFWNWEKLVVESTKITTTELKTSQDLESNLFKDSIDHELVRGTRSLTNIYERCSIAILEPTNYEEAAKLVDWRNAMEEELKMINKN